MAAVHRMHVPSPLQQLSHALIVLREALAAEKRVLVLCLLPHPLGLHWKAAKPSWFSTLQQGAESCHQAADDMNFIKVPLCSPETGWTTLRFASSCQGKETKKDCDMTLHRTTSETSDTELKAYQNIYGKGSSLESGLSLSWYLIIFWSVRKKPYFSGYLFLRIQPGVEIVVY